MASKNLRNLRLPQISPSPTALNYLPTFHYHFNWEYLIEEYYRAIFQWGDSNGWIPSLAFVLTLLSLILFSRASNLDRTSSGVALLGVFTSSAGFYYMNISRYEIFVLVGTIYVMHKCLELLTAQNTQRILFTGIPIAIVASLLHFQLLVLVLSMLSTGALKFLFLKKNESLFLPRIFVMGLVTFIFASFFFWKQQATLGAVYFSDIISTNFFLLFISASIFVLIRTNSLIKLKMYLWLQYALIITAFSFGAYDYLVASKRILPSRYFIIIYAEMYFFIIAVAFTIALLLKRKIPSNLGMANIALFILLIISPMISTGGFNQYSHFDYSQKKADDARLDKDAILLSDETLGLQYYYPNSYAVLWRSNSEGKIYNIYGERMLSNSVELCQLLKSKNRHKIQLIPPLNPGLIDLASSLGATKKEFDFSVFDVSQLCSATRDS